MRRTTARSRRLLPWLVGTVMLFVLGVLPRSHAVVCLARLGLVAAETAAAAERTAPHCSCCEHRTKPALPAVPTERSPGERRVGAHCPPGCCVDLQADLEIGPVPRADLPPMPALVAIAPFADERRVASTDHDDSAWNFDTGPPRTDARTALRGTVVLRL